MGDEILVWQDREIRFDVPVGYANILKTFILFYCSMLTTFQWQKSELACRPGEFIIDTLESVEDTKGNSGESGKV